MKTLGVLGNPLTHSFSPGYFAKKWQEHNVRGWQYLKFEFATIHEAVQALKATKNLQGFNITIPYKQEMMPFLDEVAPQAAYIGAVNCVHVHHNKWIGYNTDYIGFKNYFETLILPQQHQSKALVLGNGGASKAVQVALTDLQIPFTIVERNPKANNIAYALLNTSLLNEYSYIINTTPLGTFPNIYEAPAIPYEGITNKHVCYDLVYNPQETLFLQKCKAQGAIIKNGADMLALQADESWRIWTA
jgi:shikimate dehydrogenase